MVSELTRCRFNVNCEIASRLTIIHVGRNVCDAMHASSKFRSRRSRFEQLLQLIMATERWFSPVNDTCLFIRLQLNINGAWTEYGLGCDRCNGYSRCCGWFHCDYCATNIVYVCCIWTARPKRYSMHTSS